MIHPEPHKFAAHVQAVGQGVQGLRATFGKVREVGVGESHIAMSWRCVFGR